MEEVKSSKFMCALAFKSLESYLQNQQVPQNLINKLPNIKTKIFVTYHENGELRGCIGTFYEQNLRQQLPQYSVIAGTQDPRFQSIQLDELENLEVTVSLLVNFEECSCLDWVVGTHGIEIEFNGRSATYLPEVALEQNWDQETTLKYLFQKAGIRRRFTKDLVPQVHCVRYQSSICKMTYKEYKEYNFDQ